MAERIDDLRAKILRFVESAAAPVLIEPGEPELPLQAGEYSIDDSPAGLRLHAWGGTRSYSRRILGLAGEKPGRLDLRAARLGLTPVTVQLIDAGHRRNEEIRRKGARDVAREEFRRVLARQLPAWRIEELTTAPDLSRSLSPSYPRALLRQGREQLAAVFASPQALEPDGALTFGLIWFDYLRRRERDAPPVALALFLPGDHLSTAALRCRWLAADRVAIRLFVVDEAGEIEVERADWGNLVTSLARPGDRPASPASPEAELESILRQDLRVLDGGLLTEPVYRQTPAIAGVERGVLDLLAAEIDGRLAVIELKVSADIHLPLQALDYWMRVAWHLEQGDFVRLGYFPGVPLRAAAPQIYLVAPALEFHPTTETLLSYVDPRVPITCLGIGANWRSEVKVISRREWNEHYRASS
jgi:hypothetical protein